MRQNHKPPKVQTRGKLTRKDFKTTQDFVLHCVRERCRVGFGNSQIYVWGRDTFSFRVTAQRHEGIFGKIFQAEKSVADFHIKSDGTIEVTGSGYGFAELASPL